MNCCTYKCTNGENCPVRGLEQYKPTQIEFAGPEPVTAPESTPEPELTLSIAFTLGVCAGMLVFYAIIVFGKDMT